MPEFKVPPDILTLLQHEKNFVIATHIDPDGDTLGSGLALSAALENLGKKTLIYNKMPLSDMFDFMPGIKRVAASLSNIDPSEATLIILDCNDTERAGLENIKFKRSAIIDHHETIKAFDGIQWIEPHAAATGLLIYYLLKDLGTEITADIANNLYTAIAVDTGTFRYSNTTSGVLRVCAELIDSGADAALIPEELYQSWSDDRFRLLIMALDTLEITENIAITYVTKEMFARTGTTPADTDNFSNFPRLMKSNKVSVFFREVEEGLWKASLRSKGNINVAAIAETFQGGGHKNAAGYKIKADIKTVKEELLKAVRKIQDSRFKIQD